MKFYPKLRFWRKGKPLERLDLSEFASNYADCREFTMTSLERMYSLHTAVKYVIENDIPGDFVECGVWRGGSAMIIAKTLKELGETSRKIYMYDTFEGMPAPGEYDKDLTGKLASSQLQDHSKIKEQSVIWAIASLNDVKKNLESVSYPSDNLIFIEGKVEDTIPEVCPETICLLRLDTDWYESTLHELKYLYPKLSKSGALIIDDYGHWAGARKAVDEYFHSNKPAPLLSRIDYSGRIAIKI